MNDMTFTPASDPRIVTRAEWLKERKELLARERELTHLRDEIAAARRDLPWVRVEKDYVFDAPEGEVRLADLFGDRSQLAVYHFMLTPGSDHICDGCSLLADHIDGARQHFEQAELAFCAISRGPLSQIEAVRERMGWTFRWVSSANNDFNFDYGVSFRDQEVASGETGYNYGTTPYANPDLPGASIFAMDASGAVYHTYSTYTRGLETLVGAFNWLDLTPRGRNEDGIMSWVRLHDEYGTPAHDCCHAAELQAS